MEDRNRLISMVNTRGRVMWVHPWEIDNLREQGGRIIINPKEDYYPQYDNSVVKIEQSEWARETIESTDILECEVLT